jgi:hypothetical protein
MTFPKKFHYTDGGNTDSDQTNYSDNTASELEFKSMVTGHTVTFKAFITEFQQQFSSTWNSEEVFGRMDPIATFQGTNRSVSVGWTIPAGGLNEAKNNAQMINALATMLYPAYSSGQVEVDSVVVTTASSISRPPLIKIKFANLIQGTDGQGLLGYVDGFTFTPDLEMGMFIEGKQQYPKTYTISCQLNVLHQHDIGFDSNNEWLDGQGYKKWIFGDDS